MFRWVRILARLWLVFSILWAIAIGAMMLAGPRIVRGFWGIAVAPFFVGWLVRFIATGRLGRIKDDRVALK